MKTLSIQQPWASIICAGVKDVENRTWQPKELPVRILLHASSKKVPKIYDDILPELWLSEIRNARTMGVLKENDELPLSAIIGWADVTEVFSEEEAKSLYWGQEGCVAWKMENVHIFEEPITGVKGKLNLFDYPLDEENLPASHLVFYPLPTVKGDEVIVPVSDTIWNRIEGGSDELMLDLTPSLYELLCDTDNTDNYVLKGFTSVCVTNRGRSLRFKLTDETGIFAYPNAKREMYEYKDKNGELCVWLYIQLILGERL